MTDIVWSNVTVTLGQLQPWERNPKSISKSHAKRLLASWDKFGQFQTVAIGPGCEVYDGHQRLSVLRAAFGDGYSVAARQSSRELSDAERRELVIAAHVGTTGQFNWDELANWDAAELQEWGLDGEQMQDWKTSIGALTELIEAAKEEPPEDPGAQVDKAEELREKWGVESGQMWKLGEHRIICGDCTDRAVVERVMGGEKADMVFTDPPYNVASNSRNFAADKSKAMDDLKNAEWDKDFDITTVFPLLETVMAKDCAVYICTSQWLVQIVWEWMWSWSDFCFYCVFCKPNPMPSLAKRHWTWATELIPYAVRGKHIANFPREGHALNWWNIPKEKDTNHPTEKPLEVPERAIGFSSNQGQIVFDGFLGSGTTLIACERLTRKCRAVEISPAYVAVAIQRWVDMTGGVPELITAN